MQEENFIQMLDEFTWNISGTIYTVEFAEWDDTIEFLGSNAKRYLMPVQMVDGYDICWSLN